MFTVEHMHAGIANYVCGDENQHDVQNHGHFKG